MRIKEPDRRAYCTHCGDFVVRTCPKQDAKLHPPAKVAFKYPIHYVVAENGAVTVHMLVFQQMLQTMAENARESLLEKQRVVTEKG